MHLTLAMWTDKVCFFRLDQCWPLNPKHPLHDVQQYFGIAMQEAIVPCSPESFRQHMLENQGYKLFAGQGAGMECIGLAVAKAECHMCTRIRHQVAVADNAFIEIAREVSQGLQAATDFLALDDPAFGCGWQYQTGTGQRMQQGTPKRRGQGSTIEQVVALKIVPFPS